jgi:hypothetical protein
MDPESRDLILNELKSLNDPIKQKSAQIYAYLDYLVSGLACGAIVLSGFYLIRLNE